MLNRLSVDHECDKQTDGQIATISNSVLSHSYMRVKTNTGFMTDTVRANIDWNRRF